MSQQQLLIAVAAALEQRGIAWMVTGSVASSLFGEPRLTHDIDIVVQITVEGVVGLAATFPPPRYYLDDLDSLGEAVRQESMFNLVDTATGDKVDFRILTGSPFDRSRFTRRRRVSVFSAGIWVASPEDVILAKLHWARLLGVTDLWEKLIARAARG